MNGLPPSHDDRKGGAVSPKVSDSTIRRLATYLKILESRSGETSATVSSDALAARAGTTAAQVRKDLSHFGSFGKRGQGYPLMDLGTHLREILGLDRPWRVALIGAGRIGSAILGYADFRRKGFQIVVVLDRDPEKIGTRCCDSVVQDIEHMEQTLFEEGVELAILAVPVEGAQDLAIRAITAGVRGILNFAPVQLRVPAHVAVQNVDLVMELETLAFQLTHAEGHEVA